MLLLLLLLDISTWLQCPAWFQCSMWLVLCLHLVDWTLPAPWGRGCHDGVGVDCRRSGRAWRKNEWVCKCSGLCKWTPVLHTLSWCAWYTQSTSIISACVCVGFQVLLLLLYVCVLLALYLTPLTISSPCIMDRSNLKPQPTIISRRGAPMVLKCSFIHLYYHLLCNVFTPTLVCQASHKPHLHFAFITAKSVPLRRPQED